MSSCDAVFSVYSDQYLTGSNPGVAYFSFGTHVRFPTLRSTTSAVPGWILLIEKKGERKVTTNESIELVTPVNLKIYATDGFSRNSRSVFWDRSRFQSADKYYRYRILK